MDHKETTVRISGWTFTRSLDGTVSVKKEPLVANERLLSRAEWDAVVSALWIPEEKDGAEEAEPADDLETDGL